jgi:hypothetical protein
MGIPAQVLMHAVTGDVGTSSKNLRLPDALTSRRRLGCDGRRFTAFLGPRASGRQALTWIRSAVVVA